MGGTRTAALVARFGAADGGGRPADRESLRELALREPQGPLDVPVDLAVRGGASLERGVQRLGPTAHTGCGSVAVG